MCSLIFASRNLSKPRKCSVSKYVCVWNSALQLNPCNLCNFADATEPEIMEETLSICHIFHEQHGLTQNPQLPCNRKKFKQFQDADRA